jgi:hypothetical protein
LVVSIIGAVAMFWGLPYIDTTFAEKVIPLIFGTSEAFLYGGDFSFSYLVIFLGGISLKEEIIDAKQTFLG